MEQHSICLNCHHSLSPQQPYCASCGQQTDIHRFTVPHIFHEFFHAFTHTDKSIFGLAADLWKKPGFVIREYLAGSRKKYFNPFTFLLLVAGLSMLVLAGANYLSAQKKESKSTVQSIPDQPVRESIQSETAIDPVIAGQIERGKKVGVFMAKRQNLMMLLAVPFTAFIFWIGFSGKRANYAEHLVANIFIVSFVMLFTALLFYPLKALVSGKWGWYVMYLMLALHMVYYSFAYCQWFRMKRLSGILYIMLISIVSIMAWYFLTRFVIEWYIRG